MTFIELARALRSRNPKVVARAQLHIATLPPYLFAAWIEYAGR
jgi:hypothetical protein